MTHEPDSRAAIAAAAHAEIERRAALLTLLSNFDEELAVQAINTFGSADAASEWLLSRHHRALPGGPAIALAQTEEGRAKLMNLLIGIEHCGVM